MSGCIGGNPTCPCQDGDLCHYKDAPDGSTKGWPLPAIVDGPSGAEFSEPLPPVAGRAKDTCTYCFTQGHRAYVCPWQALAELVALYDLKREETRLRGRRLVYTQRDKAAIEQVNKMRAAYNKRSTPAWEAARRALIVRLTKD
jgi:hypothetical protein